MKKVTIVIVLMFALLTGLFVALPVMAAPSNGQKVPVSLEWKNVGPTTVIERRDVDTGISHRIMEQHWTVKMYIDGSTTPIEGTAVGLRDTVYRYGKDSKGVDQIANDHYVITFPVGGFEGNCHITLTDYVAATANPPTPATYNVHLHALFHGSEGYKGQMLDTWQIGPGTNFAWEGYLLKP